ncbi:MAG TPA: LPS export ABC transporter ATP-binding protein [Deltaproteobacteria bacterium]|nr:LPS export ABC transporter ATP-binding protein [Deltaproteobacteria bacterium]HPJ94243.1 LPS export ABC transporter ATP-binding protein [Deltaproteobacteria bacterium]HPR50932.1 LPS export ABC transporter ATP-binding protein [Deltaproteobacteria bacterium]
MGEIRLSAQGLEKSFGKAHIIKGLDLACSQGEIIGLLGPNGAGKTTTFYMVVGLIRPDKGKVFLGEDDITALDLAGRAMGGISYLPQEPSVFRGLSVEENISVPLEAKGLKGKDLLNELEDIIAGFGLEHVRKSKGVSLSGGERRRVEIARAMALNPLYLLLDEPFAGIDPITVKDIQDMIVNLKKKGIGVIITDHNVKETLKICDRAYIIHQGVVIEEGTPEEVIANDQVKKIYVGKDFVLN